MHCCCIVKASEGKIEHAGSGWQAEEERHAAEEKARLEAEAAEGDPAVAQMRRVLNKTKSGAKVADALRELEVEGGLAGKWRVLYEVNQQHKQAHQSSDVFLAWIGCLVPCKALVFTVSGHGNAWSSQC